MVFLEFERLPCCKGWAKYSNVFELEKKIHKEKESTENTNLEKFCVFVVVVGFFSPSQETSHIFEIKVKFHWLTGILIRPKSHDLEQQNNSCQI